MRFCRVDKPYITQGKWRILVYPRNWIYHMINASTVRPRAWKPYHENLPWKNVKIQGENSKSVILMVRFFWWLNGKRENPLGKPRFCNLIMELHDDILIWYNGGSQREPLKPLENNTFPHTSQLSFNWGLWIYSISDDCLKRLIKPSENEDSGVLMRLTSRCGAITLALGK